MRRISSYVAGALAVATLATTALAHEKGRLKVATRQLTPGMALELSGEKFHKNDLFTISLFGLAGKIRVGEIRADSAGKFAGSVTVPADASPGTYRLVLSAADGDEAASVDVEVGAPGAQMASGPDSQVTGEHHHHTESTEPTAEPLGLERASSPLVRGGALAGVVVALAVGATLLRRPK